MIIKVLLFAVGGLIGALVGFLARRNADAKVAEETKGLLDEARREADDIVKEAKIQAREELLTSRDEFEQSTRERRQELKQLEERLANRESNIDRKADLLETRTAQLEKRDNALRDREEEARAKQQKLDDLVTQQVAELERIAGLTREEARRHLIALLEGQLETERGALIRRFQEETSQRMEREAQEVMINAMERYANDCAYERTTSTIPLPNEEMKGRIIGREGRNIRTIEAACGVSVLIDDTPEAVVISCFDPVRREIARVALERLVEDGRIHPTRIEDMVGKVTKEIDGELMKAGQEAVDSLGLSGVRQNLVKLLGRLRYRYSYSQNVLQHSLEVAHFMGIIASQLNLDEQRAKRIGLFHDIGKAVDHEVEGSHALIGADILKRAGEDDEVVNAVAAHHEDQERLSLMAVLVTVCDTLSAGRPGARSETTELYLKRLENLESIGTSFEGVENCYAIQAGRELRVIVEPDHLDQDQAAVLARDIAQRVEMRYPGQIKVTVVRETRSVEYAK
jgi:ribonuclease Y